MSDKTKHTGLKLLNDSVFNPNTEKDAFNHGVYAKVLAKIFSPSSDNDHGISVALFGKWGQGKSSVVEMLKKELGAQNVKVVLFNAWQARGDSVRRQLFLEVLASINPAEAAKMKRFAGLEVARELLQTEEEKNSSKKHAHRNLLRSLRDDTLLGWSFFALLVLLIFPVYNFSTFLFRGIQINWASTITQTVIFPIFFFLFKYVRETVVSKYTGLLGISEPISESQRLKYPEQFKDLFVKYAALFSEKHDQELLVVVDDLDRCEPETVVEALASIRQLSGNQKYTPKAGEENHGKVIPMRCRFLVPCDEKQVVLALETDGYFAGKNGASYHDYQSEELLRKFFDVVIRMDAFVPEDMVSYAEKMLSATGDFSADDIELVQELIGAVAPKDPRQVKKLVNAFLISKAKIKAAQELKLLRSAEHLDHFDKTRLVVIALQETVPSIFSRLAEAPIEEFERLRNLKISDCNDDEKKSRNIIRALDPISHHTFSLLIRKGLPETLLELENGAEIYDAINSGNEESFAEELAKVTDISKLATWLKEHRQTVKTVAQFRNSLSCLIEPAPLFTEQINLLTFYINGFSQTKQALRGFSKLVALAHITPQLEHCKQNIYRNIISNLQGLPAGEVLGSVELKALLIVVHDLSISQKAKLAEILNPLFETEEPSTATKNLLDLSSALPENFNEAIPVFAITVARDCIWDIYPADEGSSIELHSNIIAGFAGNDSKTLNKIIKVLFAETGPLATPIQLSGSLQNGSKEAMRTLEKISPRFTNENVQVLYERLSQWLPTQTSQDDFLSVFNALGNGMFKLSEEQIDDLSIVLTDRACADAESDWLFELVEESDHAAGAEKSNYNRFCKGTFTYIAERHLTSSSISAIAKEFLANMHASSWDVATEAEAVFEEAIESKIANQATWEMWKEALWPLCRSNSAAVKQAIANRIEENVLPDILIQFSVEELFNKKLSQSLEITLKKYFCTAPDALTCEYFINMFTDKEVEGRDQVITLIIEDLSVGNVQLDEPKMGFVVKHSPLTTAEVIDKLKEYVRVRYFQDNDLNKFTKGLPHVLKMGKSSKQLRDMIKTFAQEQEPNLTAEQKEQVEEIVGKKIFEKAES